MPEGNQAPQQPRGSATPRTPLIAANWKMNKTIGETGEFLDRFLPAAAKLDRVEVVVCPPATAFAAATARADGSGVGIAAQNMHFAESGAFTGELAAPMLTDLGAWGAILGHSERRQYFGETDDALAKKVPVALAAGLTPILCIGESEGERDAGETEAVLARQLDADLAEVEGGRLGDVVIAYEPIWAIGTGRTATNEQAQEAIAFIRRRLAERDSEAAAAVRILYGGSMKPDNAGELLAQADIDGGLVGGASLDPEDFLAICSAA
jgi:triosephosphate isomerase (TIM)